MRIILQWIKANSIMLINAGSLVGTSVVTSMLGFVYWWIAARRFPLEAVGIASATVSAMGLLGSFCILGLGTLLITELPRQPDQAESLISTALVVVGVVGACVGIVFAIVASFVSPSFRPLGGNILNVLIFALGVSLTGITLVLDLALIGLLRGGLQFWRNTLFAITKLVALFVVSFWAWSQQGITIYTTWAVGILPSLIVLAALIVFKRGWPRRKYLPQWGLLRKLGPAALQHHLLNVTLQFPSLSLPVLVTALLSAKVNAWFYISWMIVNFVFYFPVALTMVLHAMNSAEQAALAHRARVTICIALVFSVLATFVLQFAAKQVLSVFGSSYSEQAAQVLRILVLAAFPLIVKNHYISVCRIHDRQKSAILLIAPGSLIELCAAALGAHFGGLLSLSISWVVVVYIEAVFMSHTVYKAIRIVKISPPPLEQSYKETEAVWLMDTSILLTLSSLTIREPDTNKKPVQKYENGYGRASRHRLKPPRLQPYTPHDSGTYIADAGKASQFLEGIYDNGTIVEDGSV